MSIGEKKVDRPDDRDDVDEIAECLGAGRPIPPDLARRVQECAEQIRKANLASHGVQDVGVQIIREIRGELPQP